MNNLKQRNGPYFALFHCIHYSVAFGANYVKVVEDKSILSATKMYARASSDPDVDEF